MQHGARLLGLRRVPCRRADPSQLVVGILVAQRDAAQLHVATAGGQRGRAGWLGEARLAVEHLEDARARGGGALGQVERHAERAHRADQHVQQQVERGELAERQVGVDHRLASHEQHGGEAELGQEADDGVVRGFQAGRDHRLLEHASGAAPEALQLAGLAGERLDDPHPGDVLLGVRGELADALLHLLDRGPRAAAVAVGDDHHERHRRECDQAQLRVDDDHHDAGEHDREDRLQDEHEAVAEEEAHRLQVHGAARHQLSRLLVVEEAQLQPLQMAVDPLAQVVFDPQRDPPGDHPPPVHRAPAQQHQRENRERQRQQRVAVVRACPCLVVLGGVCAMTDRFHGTPREDRERDGHHHREAGEGPGDGQAAAVGAQEAEESVEGRHSCLVNDYCRTVVPLSNGWGLRCRGRSFGGECGT